MRLPARWMTVLAVALGLVAGAAAMPGVPGAAAAEDCAGVWVVVDGRAAGGSVTTRCVPGDPGSGFEALRGAGYTYSFVPRIPGMVCVLDGRPDPCNGAPADAYWSYWHAEVGGSWTYATRGAAERDPDPGDVEGWAFGAGDPPSAPPPSSPVEPDPGTEPEPEPDPDRGSDPGDGAEGGGSEPELEPEDDDVGQDGVGGASGGSADTSTSPDPGSDQQGADAYTDADADTDTDADRGASPSGQTDRAGDGTDPAGAGGPPAGDDDEVAGALATSADEDSSLAGIVAAGGLIVVLASGAAWQSSRRRRG